MTHCEKRKRKKQQLAMEDEKCQISKIIFFESFKLPRSYMIKPIESMRQKTVYFSSSVRTFSLSISCHLASSYLISEIKRHTYLTPIKKKNLIQKMIHLELVGVNSLYSIKTFS
jgi:uncharacterized protein with PQ loop repeat